MTLGLQVGDTALDAAIDTICSNDDQRSTTDRTFHPTFDGRRGERDVGVAEMPPVRTAVLALVDVPAERGMVHSCIVRDGRAH